MLSFHKWGDAPPPLTFSLFSYLGECKINGGYLPNFPEEYP